MSLSNDILLLDLIKSGKLSIQSYPYQQADPGLKKALIKWLSDNGFPSDNPIEIVGDSFVEVFFTKNNRLFIFFLDFAGPEVCSGQIVLAQKRTSFKYLGNRIKCSGGVIVEE